MSLPPEAYLWFKTLHIVGVVVWFAGLFYLVRLFIYHVEAEELEPELRVAVPAAVQPDGKAPRQHHHDSGDGGCGLDGDLFVDCPACLAPTGLDARQARLRGCFAGLSRLLLPGDGSAAGRHLQLERKTAEGTE